MDVIPSSAVFRTDSVMFYRFSFSLMALVVVLWTKHKITAINWKIMIPYLPDAAVVRRAVRQAGQTLAAHTEHSVIAHEKHHTVIRHKQFGLIAKSIHCAFPFAFSCTKQCEWRRSPCVWRKFSLLFCMWREAFGIAVHAALSANDCYSRWVENDKWVTCCDRQLWKVNQS